MQLVKKIFISLSFLSFIPFTYAMQNDPCENIAGTWQGMVRSPKCTANVNATFEKYQNTLRFEFWTDSTPGCNIRVHNVLTGTCKDALVKFQGYDLTGTIFGNSISLQENDILMEFKKVHHQA